MRARKAALLAAAIAATGFCVKAARADIVVNDFDDSDSAAEVAQWSFDYGNGSFTSSDATLSFSTDDANNSPTSGSLDVKLDFDQSQTTADQAGAIQRNGLGGLDASTSGILMLDADIKAVTGSATDQFGQSGFFNMFHANGPSFQFVSDFGDNLHPGSGWVHVDVPVGTPNDSINSLVAQVYDNGSASGFPGPNGLVEFRMDNVKFITTPPPPPPPGVERAAGISSLSSRPAKLIQPTPVVPPAPHLRLATATTEMSSITRNPRSIQPTARNTLRLSQPLGTYPNVGTQGLTYNGNVQYSSSEIQHPGTRRPPS